MAFVKMVSKISIASRWEIGQRVTTKRRLPVEPALQSVENPASTAVTEQQGVCAGDKKSPAPISIDRKFNFFKVEFSP